MVSAFIKSMRGSDPDAAVYWMMRMLEAGDDPLFVLRRMLIFASEDVGNADSRALLVVVAADQAFRRMGMPEGLYPLAHACVYLASAPKSNAVNVAWHRAKALVDEHGALPVPKKLRNAVTKLMKDEGYGAGLSQLRPRLRRRRRPRRDVLCPTRSPGASSTSPPIAAKKGGSSSASRQSARRPAHPRGRTTAAKRDARRARSIPERAAWSAV